MIIVPEKLGEYSAYDLLRAAGNGTVAIDQRWIHALVDHPDRSVPDIVRFAGEDHQADPVHLNLDLVSVIHFLKEPRGVPFLLELIRENPSDISDEVVEALVAIGQPAIDPLLDLYHKLDPKDGGEIAFLLAGMGIRDPRILALLLSRLDVDFSDALFHLEIYGDPAVIPELEKRMPVVTEDQALDLNDTIEDLREPKPGTHVSDFNIWEFYPEIGEADYDLASVPDRLELLSSPSAEQRQDVIRSFFGEELPPAVRAKVLELALHDPDPFVRGRAWSVFFRETLDPNLRKTMMERFTAPDTPKRERAGLAIGLCAHADQPDIRRGIEDLAKDPETRAWAIEAMWRSFDASFGPVAVGYFDDPDEDVRRNVIWAIGYLNVSSSAGLLRQFFDDEELRAEALHNYALAAPGRTSRKQLETLLNKVREVANGLTDAEEEAVRVALDVRLQREGLPEYFAVEDPEPEPEPARTEVKVGRNDPCPCGSGKKYKKCCGQ